ncbi:uncharacterized protein CTRU02_209621 [Colletotrichum truncatum]|uniref:Uncharacterized protein n=1 Tax=Colletotrichum truncatum TaxID=5467 RepID=A0ACC3YSV8_COLTU|nr:uncharacterized protein CTRU02_12078 [Colletotrichum truncatum]KAF6785146.1 hypothetical protein CTRU02_12078 [Colletotrichum truncatum]
MHLPRWVFAAIQLVTLASGQTCYWPSGGTASALQPCSVASGNEVAACCFANHYCMTNGLCLSPTEGTWYRGGCTDKDYLKPGCPQICDKDNIVGATPGRHAAVWACASRVFACSSLDNCSKQNFTVGAYRAVMNSALQTDLGNDTASATTTAASTGATSTGTGGTGAASTGTGDASATTCPSIADASQGISTGAAAGIGVGVGLPLAIATGALAFMLLRERKKTRAALASYQMQPGHNQQHYTSPSSPWGKPGGHYVPVAEVHGQQMPTELPENGTQNRHELAH